MEKNFMIRFQFEGRQVYANVFEHKHSPAVYRIHFIDHVAPRQITLYERDDKIVADTADNLNPKLVESVIREIERNPNRL